MGLMPPSQHAHRLSPPSESPLDLGSKGYCRSVLYFVLPYMIVWEMGQPCDMFVSQRLPQLTSTSPSSQLGNKMLYSKCSFLHCFTDYSRHAENAKNANTTIASRRKRRLTTVSAQNLAPRDETVNTDRSKEANMT